MVAFGGDNFLEKLEKTSGFQNGCKTRRLQLFAITRWMIQIVWGFFSGDQYGITKRDGSEWKPTILLHDNWYRNSPVRGN